jgi:peptide/nickel transport system substrate-binding protein
VKSFLHSLFNRHYRIKLFEKTSSAIRAFSLTERIIFFSFAAVFAFCSMLLLLKVNNHFLVEIPRVGGTLNEGIIGTPRFINPLLTVSDSDKDIAELVYSGLMRATSDGKLVPDLAESYTISPDNLTYNFILKPNVFFHDGTRVTADDIVFTIEKAKDAALKSPKRANWDGITVEKINDQEIKFTLKQPYAPFLVNTTLGILPKHIWGGVSDEEFAFSNFNIEPIGTGPYKINKIRRNSSGIPEFYDLVPFNKFTLGNAYISHLIILHFYPNEKELSSALNSNDIESIHSVMPEKAKELESQGYTITRFPLSRIFGVFFNQSHAAVLAHKEVRQALDAAIDKDAIINQVLYGYGTTINGPVPSGLPQYADEDLVGITSEDPQLKIERAEKILTDAGWSKNADGIMQKKTTKGSETLTFTISTGNTKELEQTATLVKEMWEKVGAKVDVKVFESTDLNQNIIRSRKYDALLFGEVIGRDLDFYSFWHSSQRNDPGLNVAMYANSKVDKILEEARQITDQEERLLKHKQFIDELNKDAPAVFLYSPDLLYLVPASLKGMTQGQVRNASDRFSEIYTWYIETDKVWKIFSQKFIQN